MHEVNRYYLSLSVVIFLLTCLIGATEMRGPLEEVDIAPLAAILAQDGDAESRLALGARLPLSSATLYELELIPGVSDTLGQNILRVKERVLARARTLPPLEDHRAFEIVHGVAAKKAKLLSAYLDPTR